MENFATKNATASQIFPLFWKAVRICETQCPIKVVATTSHGASANLKFFRIHFGLTHNDELNADTDVVYKTINFFSEDKRYISLCLKRYLCYVQWWSLFNMEPYKWHFLEDQECGLQLLPKITNVYLTQYSVMNVRLAAKVLNTTVSKVLPNYGPADAAETV